MPEPYQDYDSPIPDLPPDQLPLVMVVCPDCGKTVYEEDCIISRGGDGKTRSYCVDCHHKQPEKVRQQRKAAKSAEQFRKVIRAIGQSSAPTISDLCLALTTEFGGVSGFARFFYTQLSNEAQKTPGSAKVLSACSNIAKIIAASTVYQASRPDVAGLADRQLCEEWERGIKEVIAKIPKQELLELAEDVEDEKARHKGKARRG